MECAICGQTRDSGSLVVFSPEAYQKVLLILKRSSEKAAPGKGRAIHVCRDCLQGSYQYSKA